MELVAEVTHMTVKLKIEAIVKEARKLRDRLKTETGKGQMGTNPDENEKWNEWILKTLDQVCVFWGLFSSSETQ